MTGQKHAIDLGAAKFYLNEQLSIIRNQGVVLNLTPAQCDAIVARLAEKLATARQSQSSVLRKQCRPRSRAGSGG